MSLTRKQVLDLAKLSRRRERVRQGRFLVEGVRSVEASVDGYAPLEMLLVTDEAMNSPRVNAFIDKADTHVEKVDNKTLARIADVETSQGVVGIARRITTDSIEALRSMTRVLVLAGVQDPGNVGTLIRTAAWFGIDGILSDASTADFESPKVVRATMGGLWGQSLVRVKETREVLDMLRDEDFEVVGADLGGESMEAWHPRQKTALVLGSEAGGVPKDVTEMLDRRVAIFGAQPQSAVESLNVAIAGGILMAHWSRMA